MTSVFDPAISIPAREGDMRPDDSGLSAEQRDFAEALRLAYADHAAALEAGDVDRLMAFFSDDVVWMGAGWPSRFGQSDLRDLFDQVAGTARVHCQSLRAFVAGDCGWNFVDYHVTPNDAAVAPWTFRTSFQWARTVDGWRCNGVLCFTA